MFFFVIMTHFVITWRTKILSLYLGFIFQHNQLEANRVDIFKYIICAAINTVNLIFVFAKCLNCENQVYFQSENTASWLHSPS